MTMQQTGGINWYPAPPPSPPDKLALARWVLETMPRDDLFETIRHRALAVIAEALGAKA